MERGYGTLTSTMRGNLCRLEKKLIRGGGGSIFLRFQSLEINAVGQSNYWIC